MAKLKLTLACGNYDRTRALIEGRVQPEGIELNVLPLVPGEIFWRMLNNGEFDASEMSLSSYTILRSQGDDRFIALPVFPSRVFRHGCIYVNSAAGIKAPVDLRGKRVGLGDYQMTASVWVRGLLQHEYGVSPEEIHWVLAAPVYDNVDLPPRFRTSQIGPGQNLEKMLETGAVDALVSVVLPRSLSADTSIVERLFPDYREVETEYYRRTRIFPIMHTLVLKRELLTREPWTAVSLYKAFVTAKEVNYAALYDSNALRASLPWLIDEIEKSRRIFGPEIWDYSIEGSRPTLDAFVQYLEEQGLTSRRMKIEELFTPNIRPEFLRYLRGTGEA
jgi:4,5-dihydroxyphthalate decarboxylase